MACAYRYERFAEKISVSCDGIVSWREGSKDIEFIAKGQVSSSLLKGGGICGLLRDASFQPRTLPKMTLERVREILAEVRASVTMPRGSRPVSTSGLHLEKRDEQLASSNEDEDPQMILPLSSSVDADAPRVQVVPKLGECDSEKPKAKVSRLEKRGIRHKDDRLALDCKSIAGDHPILQKRRIPSEEDDEDTQHGCLVNSDNESFSVEGSGYQMMECNYYHHSGERFGQGSGNAFQHLHAPLPRKSKRNYKANNFCARDSKGRYKKSSGGRTDRHYKPEMASGATSDPDINRAKGQSVADDVLSISESVHSLTSSEKTAVEYFTTEKKELTEEDYRRGGPKPRRNNQSRFHADTMIVDKPTTHDYTAERSRRRKRKKFADFIDQVHVIMSSSTNGNLFPGSSSKVENWDPPMSPYRLIQEGFRRDAWKVILSSMLLNKSTGRSVKKIVGDLFDLCPDAESAVKTPTENIADIVYSLGLQNKRAKMIQRFSSEYLRGEWNNVSQLHGVTKYATDSYAIFYQGLWREVQPEDSMLRKYRSWLQELHGQEAESEYILSQTKEAVCI
ncbi:methyl-CpG-binding domain protein 4 [Marchantia polymorpha subsp. ruderalis]